MTGKTGEGVETEKKWSVKRLQIITLSKANLSGGFHVW